MFPLAISLGGVLIVLLIVLVIFAILSLASRRW